MPQYSSSKNSLMPTGPKAKHQLRYKYYDFRDIISGTEAYTKICTVSNGRFLVVAIPQRRNQTIGIHQAGEVSVLKVDKNGVLYDREIIDEGTSAQAYLGTNLSVYSSTGYSFTMAYGTRDTNNNNIRSVVVKQYHKIFQQVEYTYTIPNPDQTGTSAVGGQTDSFGGFAGTIHLLSEDSLIITSPDYDNGLSGSGDQLAGRLYRYSRTGSTWSLIETRENLNINNTRFLPYTWGWSVSGVENSSGDWQYMVGWPEYSAFASNFIGVVGLTENTTAWGSIAGSAGDYMGSNVYMDENYFVVVASEETDANGDECVIRVYNKPENFSGSIASYQIFNLGTPPVAYPFRGNGTGDTINNKYWGGESRNAVSLGNEIKIDNDILYVMNTKARPNAEGQDGAISKHDLVTGQFIDYYHLPDRGTPSGTDLAPSFDVYSGRAFVLVGEDAKPSSVSGNVIMGTGIHVIDDLIKPDSFWDEFGETVVAIEQVSTKALTTTYTTMEAVDNEGYRAIEFFNYDRNIALAQLRFPLDMPTSGWVTVEMITKIDEVNHNQCICQIKHATNSAYDIFFYLQSSAEGGNLRINIGTPGGNFGGSNLATLTNPVDRYIHRGLGWDTNTSTSQNIMIWNDNGGGVTYDDDSQVDVPSNYDEIIIGTADSTLGVELDAGWVAQIKISSTQQYTSATGPFSSFNTTDPVSTNSRLEMDDNTIFMWEAPTLY